MTSKDPLPRPSKRVIFECMEPPSTVGALALAYLYTIQEGNQEKTSKLFNENASYLIQCTQSSQVDLQDYSLLLTLKALESQDVRIKKAILKANGIEAFCKLMKNPHKHVRLMSIEICDSLYKNFESAQRVFIRNKGEWELVQLMKREGDDERVLVGLLEFVFDLVFVRVT